MKNAENRRKGSSSLVFVLVVLILVVAAAYFFSARNPSVQAALRHFQESAQDTATTSRVRTALLLSKNVSPYEVRVETTQGEVTLSGQVPSEQVKAVAGAIVQDTSGVKEVHNNLTINAATTRNAESEHLGDRIADLEIKTLLSESLSQNADLAGKHIQADVKSKIVTLGGTVDTAPQKYAAEQIAWQTTGVQGVVNNLSAADGQTIPESADAKLAHRVEFEMYSTKAISLKTVQVHADNGIITLTGNVSSRAEKLLAEKIAQSTEGVRKVVNSLDAPDESQS